MKRFNVKLRKSWRKTNYNAENQNTLDSLACAVMLHEMKDAG